MLITSNKEVLNINKELLYLYIIKNYNMKRLLGLYKAKDVTTNEWIYGNLLTDKFNGSYIVKSFDGIVTETNKVISSTISENVRFDNDDIEALFHGDIVNVFRCTDCRKPIALGVIIFDTSCMQYVIRTKEGIFDLSSVHMNFNFTGQHATDDNLPIQLSDILAFWETDFNKR